MSPDNRLGISVVICTYNGKERIWATLESILKLKFSPALFELIVVDNASKDDTRKFCDQFLSDALPAFSWKVVAEDKPGLNYARLKGLREAKFDWVLFCDDDNSLAPDYLTVALEIFKQNKKIGVLGGCGIPVFESEKPDWFDRYSHSFAVGPQALNNGKISRIPSAVYGAGSFYRKAPLLKFFDKGFNTIMSDRKGNSLVSGGDIEWCYLVQLAGYEIWYDHRLKFVHNLSDSRMKWEYYLRLKQGIASGAGRLLPYTLLLKNRNMGLVTYSLHWFFQAVFSTLLYYKNKIRTFVIAKPLKPEIELAQVILQTKMVSYWGNGGYAFRHFRYLKKLL